ncbi:rab GTPase-binding effector protein 1 isoform X1 [Leptopilina heterotoma]|uniref:rab GTPase-binding effector protein 1 isoform X1 n=1 Tax=Leptopilina heterotoma TaxID=63436 RepID=UPI001CA9592D|nr:rab GTPase-binding effector protein 1 isoform X1 [Leptopilina heterotoma]
MDNSSEESQGLQEENKTDDVQAKLQNLETESKHMQEQFNIQRAKMKELFLQKEEELKQKQEEYHSMQKENVKLKNELDDVKSQLTVVDLKTQNDILFEKRKAQEEIASLQQVINETVEESSSSCKHLDNEVRKLKSAILRLEEENSSLRMQIPRDPPTDGPISLSTVTKTLARKVVSQLGADNLSLGSDNLEESMRKVNKYAQEDAEVLRSLVGPLEEEIKALKEKLRATDEELQKCKELPILKPALESVSGSESVCNMCVNYEAQLVRMQEDAKNFDKQLQESNRLLQSQKDDLFKEVEFRKGMEEKWNEKKEEHKIKMEELTLRLDVSQQSLNDLKQAYNQTFETVKKELTKLVVGREEVQKHLDDLQKRNEYLTGKHSKHSQALQNENINMPNSVEELHVSLLRIREELIVAKVAQEVSHENEETLRCEVNLLHEQMDQDTRLKEQQEAILLSENMELKTQLETCSRECESSAEKVQRLDQIEKRLDEVLKEKEKLETTVNELRQRLSSLQQDLDTSEEVQKDFVRLSQSLQIQLEKIREGNIEVRWQHDEDVEECPSCHIAFSGTKKKVHCRHCGHIFCQSCLKHQVLSGPKRRPSRVCMVCHTLLVRDTAPYFSREPPHTPD